MNYVPLPPATKFITWDSDPYCLRMWLYLEIGGFGLVATSCLILVTLWTVASRLLCPRGFLGKRTGMGCRFLLQGIFPTQELNPGLLHCRQILYRLSHKESPYLEIRAQEAQNHLPRSLIKYSIMSNKKNPLTILLQRITRIAVWLPVWFFSLCSGTWRHTQSSLRIFTAVFTKTGSYKQSKCS